MFADLFDPVGYSSGEAAVAVSDAQTVDFGFGGVMPLDAPGTIGAEVGVAPFSLRASEIYEQNYGVTPENTTSDFGAVTYPFSMDTVARAVKQLTVAVSVAKGALQPAGTASASGGRRVGTAARPPQTNVRTIMGSTSAQSESALRRTFTGQLGGADGGSGAGSWMSLALLGAGAAILYLAR